MALEVPNRLLYNESSKHLSRKWIDDLTNCIIFSPIFQGFWVINQTGTHDAQGTLKDEDTPRVASGPSPPSSCCDASILPNLGPCEFHPVRPPLTAKNTEQHSTDTEVQEASDSVEV